MHITLILACTVGVALSTTTPPPKCCSDREFEVIMGEVGGSMYSEHGHMVQSYLQGYNKVYYDAHSEKMAIESVITTDGNTTKTNIVFDYAKKGMYVTAQDGSCIRYPIKEAFRPPCIPDEAVFDGFSYIGFGVQQLELVNWRYLEPGTDHLMRVSSTREGCVPVVLTQLGHFNGSVMGDAFFLYNNFTPFISKRSVFRTPHHCSDGDHFNPVIGRSLRGVKALYTK